MCLRAVKRGGGGGGRVTFGSRGEWIRKRFFNH